MGLPLPDGVEELLDRPGDIEADDTILAQSASRARIPWDTIRDAPHGILAGDAPETRVADPGTATAGGSISARSSWSTSWSSGGSRATGRRPTATGGCA